MSYSKLKKLWYSEIDPDDFDNNCDQVLAWFDSIRYKGLKSIRQKGLQKIRGSVVYKNWKKSVLERDNYKCTNCGISDVTLYAHHIKPFISFPDERFNINNGTTLCFDCHCEVDEYFRKIMKGKK